MERVAKLAKALGGLGLVLAGAALVLWAVDCGALLAVGPRERTFRSVNELERAVRTRLALPAYFPATLRWPPSQIRLSGRAPVVALLGFSGQEGGPERLYISQIVAGGGELPEDGLGGVVLESRDLEVGGEPALLERVKGVDGALWYRLTWSWRGRPCAMRSRGSLDELLRMAATIRRDA